MKVLVTGITGFIGSELAHKLLERGHEVYGIVKHVPIRNWAPIEDIKDKITVINANLNDRHSLKNALKKCNPDAVIHLAALSPGRLCFEEPFEAMQTNFFGTMNLIYAILELEISPRVVVASSAEVYGLQESKPFTEDLPLNPTNNYAVAKTAVDAFMRMLFKVHDFNGVVLRPANTYGRKFEKDYFTEYLIEKMLKNEEIYIGNPDSIKDYLFVDDHVNAYILAMETPEAKGQVFGIGTGQGFTNGEWALKIAEVLGFDKSRIHLGQFPPGYPSRPNKSEQTYTIINASKAKQILGWEPKVRAEEGIKKTIEYIKKDLNKYQD